MLGTFHSALPDELTAGQRHTATNHRRDGLSVRYYRKAVLASSASSAASAMCWLSRLADELRARANVAYVRTAA